MPYSKQYDRATKQPPAEPQDLLAERKTINRLRRFAWLMDSSISLPGGMSVGLDGLLGLLPVVGDVVGALIAGYVVFCGQRLKMPKKKLALMVGNILLELGLGCIPVLGDLHDFYFKANQKNVRLIETYYAELVKSQTAPAREQWSRPGVRSSLVLLILVLLALSALLLWY